MSPVEVLFEAALTQVESESIRRWASSDHNRPLWLQLAKDYLPREKAATWLAVDIVSTAIGLW